MRNLRHLFFLVIVLLSLPLCAQTEDDARNAAMNFLQKRKAVSNVKLTSVMVSESGNYAKSIGGNSASSSQESNVYAFNAEGGGFALVCTGNGNTTIAGYSDTGSVDAANVPDAMKSWLKGYQQAMAKSTTLGTKEPSWDGPTVKPVAPFLKTQWGQSAPFNSKCPSNGKQTALVGCVPVALAQVLNYYHQDRKGGGSLYYAHLDSETEYDIDYSTTTYDWKNMLNTYDDNATKAQKDAVGKLMLECGIASKATYGYTSTSANIPFVALNKYYNFDCMFVPRDYIYSWDMFTESDYYISTKKWMSMIQEELEAGRPIIYSATDLEGGAGVIIDPRTSHCFVLDGIDEQNYVHVNWGWAGSMDGYYDVAILNPGISFNYEQGFRCQHEMIIGIQPRSTDYKEVVYQAFVPYDWVTSRGDAVESKPNTGLATLSSADVSAQSSTSDVITSKSKMYYHLIRNSYDSKQTYFTTVLTKDGNIVKILPGGYYNQSVSGFPNINRWNLVHGFSKVPVGLDDGVYDIRVAYQDESGKTLLCPAPKQIIPTMEIVNNGAGMIIRGIEGDDIDGSLTIQNIAPASEIYAKTAFYLSLTGKGYSKGTTLYFRNVETGKLYKNSEASSFHHIYDDYTSTIITKCVPKNVDNSFSMPAGRYKIELPEDEKDVTLAGDFYIDVQEQPAYPILDGNNLAYASYSTYKADDVKAHGCNYIPNNTLLKLITPQYSYANKNEDPVRMNVYMINKDTGEEKLLAVDNEWVPKQSITLNRFFFPLTGNYEFRCRYVTPNGERVGLMPSEYYKHDDAHSYTFYYEDKNITDYFQLVSAKVASNSTRSSGLALQLGLKSFGSYMVSGATLTGLFYNEKSGELISETLENIDIPAGETANVVLSSSLDPNEKYEVTLLLQKYTWQGRGYLLNEDLTIARLSLQGNTLTGIDNVKASGANGIFKDGELITVYDLSGKVIQKVIASEQCLPKLMPQIPSGTYILKSASKTIKFMN